MPVTRSQNGASQKRTGTSGTASNIMEGTTTTSTEYATATVTTGNEETSAAASTETASQPALLALQAGEVRGSTKTLVATTEVPRQARSARSTVRRQELEARKELAKRELTQAQAAVALARAELELLQEEYEDSEVEDEDRTVHVQNWVQATIEERSMENPMVTKENENPPPSAEPEHVNQEKIPLHTCSCELKALTDAIIGARSQQRQGDEQMSAPPKYMHDLPHYDGNYGEWLAFKAVYEDSAHLFSPVQNTARLRKAVTGFAKEAIRSTLFADTTPEKIMEALRRRFGRPDALVMAELEKVRSLPKINDSARDVVLFASEVNNSINAIRGLKKPQYLYSTEIVQLTVDRLPSVLRYRWYDFTKELEEGEETNLVQLGRFLEQQADLCGAFAALKGSEQRRSAPQRLRTHTVIEEDQMGEGQPDMNAKVSCPQCDKEHVLTECQQFLQASIDRRWEIVKKARMCFKCLRRRHRKESCRRPPCKVCKRRHHTLLHSYEKPTKFRAPEENKIDGARGVTNNVAPVNVASTAKAYLKIVPVELYGPKGSMRVLALLDEGSTVSLVDSDVAERIGASGPEEALAIETVGGRVVTNANSMKLDIRLKGVHRADEKTLRGVRTIDEIHLTPQRVDRQRLKGCEHLKNLIDKLHYEEEAPRLLIGQDNWELIVTRALRRGKPGQPVASLTALGWVLHGSDTGNRGHVHFLHCAHVKVTSNDDLDRLINGHFAIEAIGVQPNRPSTDAEEQALRLLEKTSRRLEGGRFETGLLWKSEEERMPSNFKAAENRLRNIEKRLDKDPKLKKEYEEQIQHLLNCGYAEEAPLKSTSPREWYLPHFAVVHPTKKKVRIVYDAAAKIKGKCLNDALLPGPDLLQSLFGVLIRFRQGPVAVVADIKEMFLQIRIRQEDRDSLRFLWRGERREGPPKVYRMTSVVFGAASSPSTAIFIKNRNARDYEEEYPTAAKAIERNHYMDDYLHSFRTTQEAAQISKEVDFIHKKAGFELRGWASNHSTALRGIAEKEEGQKVIDLGQKEEKTLGLRWLVDEDALGFRAALRNTPEDVLAGNRLPTKREVTSAVMSTFDPMGLACPVLIQGKKLLQDIWRSGVGWDESIKEEECVAWSSYLERLQLLRKLHIPRCVAPSCTEGELHTFTDASEKAYAAAVYWRTKDGSGENIVSLVAGKARVTPLKSTSVPRLELQAALLGTRLAHSVEEEMDLIVTKKVYWTDSSTVLAWIRSDPRTFKAFVAHRLAEIEETTKPQQWRWVPTALNPADDATRQIPEEFGSEHRWFKGPSFLHEAEEKWPQPRSFKKEPTPEDKEGHTTASARVRALETVDSKRFSKWTRLLRTIARVLQFIELCRAKKRGCAVKSIVNPTRKRSNEKYEKKPESSPRTLPVQSARPLEATLLKKAENILIMMSQEESFGRDIARIQHEKPLDNDSKLKKLDVEIENGLLRLRGRINAIEGMSDDYKKPLVLDSQQHITRLLLASYHEKFNHGNHATVMNEVRQRYWILGLRAAVRTILHQCQWCRLHHAVTQRPPIGDLPAERLKYGAPPFTCAAVDYFGPMTVTVGRRHEKRWGALFTCLTTRAVHLESVPSLSTDSMILALRRLAARRGMPTTMFSDNGTNFVGANRELKRALEELKKEDIITEAEKLGVKWKFIPPGAPNMGGAWERLVRSVKCALAATLNERHPKDEVLHTLLLEAEHIVNSRPLTDINESADEEALTPNHFLIGRSCGAPRLGAFTDDELTGRQTWKATQRLADHFWSRWVKEYLPNLLPRKTDGRVDNRDLRNGDVVLVVDHTLPRCTWPRGRIINTRPGPDGRVRVVDIQTAGGVLRRPSTKVILLVPSPQPEDGAPHEGEDVSDGPQD